MVGDGGGVRSRFGSGQREAGNLVAAREPRQIIVALLLGAVAQQQLRRSQRVRHHHGDAARHRAARHLDDDCGMGERGKAEPAIGLGNDDPEEIVLADEIPRLFRQVAVAADLPIVQHLAKLRHRPVEECLFLGRQRRLRIAAQLFPIGLAGEQIGVPPHRARGNGVALGVRHGRQHLAHIAEHAPGNVPAPPGDERRHVAFRLRCRRRCFAWRGGVVHRRSPEGLLCHETRDGVSLRQGASRRHFIPSPAKEQ